MTNTKRKNIAIIGTGISGLGAASLLHPHHNITVYEKNDYIGGHSRTVSAPTKDGAIAVDTGFIVFNKRNYPLLTRLFEHLNVPIAKSDMSFGASIDKAWLEYGTQHISHIFAQKKNLLKPAFWRMLFDIVKFNKQAKNYLTKDTSISLEQCLNELNMGTWFRNYFLLPMAGAIWSMPLADMLRFPAATLIRFFDNHGLLTINDHPQWYTVCGGSQTYVQLLTTPFNENIRLNCGAQKLWRTENGVMLQDTQGNTQLYDDIVLACHADQALNIIADPTPQEQAVLSAFKYQPNRAVLHTDTSFMPQKRKAWASWVYLSEQKSSNMSLSYWMNNLQPLNTTTPLIVTLNPAYEPAKCAAYNDYLFEHPVFDQKAIDAQSQINAIQGQKNLWFCGAYQRYGFHEDGLNSAVNMAKIMGIEPAW